MESATDIAQDALESRLMWLSRVMHVQADLLYCIRDIWPGEGEVLECSCKTAIIQRILDWGSSNRGNFRIDVNWSTAQLALSHPGTI